MVHDGGMPETLTATLTAAASIPESTMPIWMCLGIGAVGWVIDYSAIGVNEWRDRVAAFFYLASALGWFQRLGLASWEERMLAPLNHDVRVIWAMGGAVVIFMWCCAMIPAFEKLGRLGAITFRKSAGTPGAAATGKTHTITAVKSGNRINTYLLTWTILFAASIPTVMPEGDFVVLVALITDTVNGMGTTAGTFIGDRMGWN